MPLIKSDRTAAFKTYHWDAGDVVDLTPDDARELMAIADAHFYGVAEDSPEQSMQPPKTSGKARGRKRSIEEPDPINAAVEVDPAAGEGADKVVEDLPVDL